MAAKKKKSKPKVEKKVKKIKGPEKAGFVIRAAAFIVDRSGGNAKFDVPRFSVFEMKVITYQPEACPLCAEGIEIEKPGSRKS